MQPPQGAPRAGALTPRVFVRVFFFPPHARLATRPKETLAIAASGLILINKFQKDK